MRPTPVQPNPPSQTTTATAHTHMNHMLERTPLHSQACIAGSKKGDTARLLVKTGELETPLALCVLRDGGAENANLDLVFDEYAEFSVAGAAAVHVTGYLMPEFEGGVLLGELRVVRIPEELVFWHAGGPGLSATLEADHPASTNVHAHGRRAEDEHDESDEEGHDDMFSLHDEDDSDFDSEEGGAGLGRHGERVGHLDAAGAWLRDPRSGPDLQGRAVRSGTGDVDGVPGADAGVRSLRGFPWTPSVDWPHRAHLLATDPHCLQTARRTTARRTTRSCLWAAPGWRSRTSRCVHAGVGRAGNWSAGMPGKLGGGDVHKKLGSAPASGSPFSRGLGRKPSCSPKKLCPGCGRAGDQGQR